MIEKEKSRKKNLNNLNLQKLEQAEKLRTNNDGAEKKKKENGSEAGEV
jgi:hypothetical protein